MTDYAEIAVNVPVDRTFHYHIPPELAGRVQPGHLVRVGFGTAMQPGIVVALVEESPVPQTKPVIELLDPEPVVNQAQIALARWMQRRYLAPPGPSLWLMLPPGMTGNPDKLVALADVSVAPDDALQARIVTLLKKRGPLRGEQIQRATKVKNWRGAVDALQRTGAVSVEPVLTPPRVRPKRINVAALAIHPDRIADVKRHLGKRSREADLLAHIADEDGMLEIAAVKALPGIGAGTVRNLLETGYVFEDGNVLLLDIPREDVDDTLFDLRRGETDYRVLRMLARQDGPVDVSWVYAQTGADLKTLKRLESLGFVWLGEERAWRDPLADRDFVPVAAPDLTPAQREVWAVIRAAMVGSAGDTTYTPDKQGPGMGSVSNAFLLHGVTGSGKTEIYLRAIAQAIAQGRQALLLVPEIALTPQTIRRVAARFPGQVGVLHSGLSDGERYDTWTRARSGELDVIVGARSAVFAPLRDPGVVILDEAHDNSYKQSPPLEPPHYHTRDVAERLARENGAVLILGTATPDVETFHRAQQGELALLHLPQRIMGHRRRVETQAARVQAASAYHEAETPDAVYAELPPVDVVDMREELKSGNTAMFSRALQNALGETLARGEQAILFLNRRGQSTYVFCRDCGYVERCPHCDTPLTFHREGMNLQCHHCGHRAPVPQSCPDCRSRRIKYFGAGTQQVQAAVNAQFPSAVALRWDADSVSGKGHHEMILQRFISREANVLIGTQMVAKGLDLPYVTLVGVVSADVGLALPDFRAGERVFQLLTQVAGRAGRGVLGGRVILQTYQPDHYAIQAASKHDFYDFFAREIAYRRDMGYPPFRRFVRIEFRDANEERVRKEAERTAALLRDRISERGLTGTEMIGPAPSFFGRINRLYRWHLLLRGPNPVVLLDDVPQGRGWSVDVDPLDIL